MSSDVQICSNALISIGSQPINSLPANADAATSDRQLAALNLWPTVRDSVLRSHPWNCAIKRVVLSPDETAPAFGYGYAFLLPGDCLRVLTVGERGHERDYLVEGQTILCDDAVVHLRYVWRNENVATWDALLIDAMTAALAARLAIAISGDQGKKVEFERSLMAVLKTARAVDGQEDPPETLGDFALLGARMGGYTPGFR